MGAAVELSENTQLEVQELATNDDQFRVRLKMLTGRTVSRVLRLLGVGDAFEISTPSSTVSVRGTVFVVQVLDANTTYVGCDKGVVWVVSGDQQAEVPAGQELIVTQNQAPKIQPKPTQEPATPESSGQNTSPTDPPISTPVPVKSPAASLPTSQARNRRPRRQLQKPSFRMGAKSTPGAPAVTSGSSGPKAPRTVPARCRANRPRSCPVMATHPAAAVSRPDRVESRLDKPRTNPIKDKTK